MGKGIKFTLIIPAYNEAKIIRGTIESVVSFLSKKTFSWEVIVVDDGSSDTTPEIVKNFKESNVRLVRLTKNQGKGAAIRAGVKLAKGDSIVFSDADLSVPLKNIDVFIKELEKGSEVVIGSRRVKGAKIVVHQPWLRENMGRVFTFLTNLVTGVGISDFTCGFKGFSKKAARKIWGSTLVDRWAYDSEVLFLAKKYGFKIGEIPVSWKNREDTRVVLGSAVLTSFTDLLKIRFNDILGRYDKDKEHFKK